MNTTTGKTSLLRLLCPAAALGTLFCSFSLAAAQEPVLGTWEWENSRQDFTLLPDGTVRCQKWTTGTWDRLTPDTSGSYLNGTWSIPARMLNDRDKFQSQILRDGRLFVAGGMEPIWIVPMAKAPLV